MTDPRPFDVDRDDALLDALARGAQPDADHQIAVMLAAWRADLATPAEAARPVRATVPAVEVSSPVPVTAVPAPRPAVRTPAPPARSDPTSPRPRGAAGGPGRRRSPRLRLAVAAVAAALLAGGTAAAASIASPNSPLWPVTQLLYPQRADRLAAQQALAQARQAIREGRVGDAGRLLNEAQALIARVDDPAERSRLRAELEQIRKLLSVAPGVLAPGSGSQPGPSGGPGTTTGPSPGQLLPSLLPPSVLPTSLVPSPLLPPSLLPTLPPLLGS